MEHRVIALFEIKNAKVFLADTTRENLPARLNEYYLIVGDAVVSAGGEIHKYVFDEILASFRDSGAYENAETKAKRAFKDISKNGACHLVCVSAAGPVQIAEVGHPSFQVKEIFGEPVNEVYSNIQKIE